MPARIMKTTITLLAILLASACGPDAPVEMAEVARPIKMMTVGTTNGDATLEISGSVFAAQSAELGFEVAGRMSDRMVEEGQLVAAGQTLAKLDPRDYLARRDKARASRDTARADYERYAKAFESNAVTEQEVSRAKGQFDVAQADLDVAQKALDDTELRAPFGGRIAKRLVDDFASVNAKQPVLLLQDASSLELRVDVAERDWAHADSSISHDQVTEMIKPRVRIASLDGREFPAYLKELSPSADPVTRTYRVTFGFERPTDANVSPGMTGSVVVDRYRMNVMGAAGVAIPANAVVADPEGNPFVWVVEPTSMRVSQRPVVLGELSDGTVSIVSGLSGGERIVVSGVNSVTANMLVKDLDNN